MEPLWGSQMVNGTPQWRVATDHQTLTEALSARPTTQQSDTPKAKSSSVNLWKQSLDLRSNLSHRFRDTRLTAVGCTLQGWPPPLTMLCVPFTCNVYLAPVNFAGRGSASRGAVVPM